ncbi:MAG: DNA mismatch repair endonuclease MutL, partial [Mariprofundaceae bacterium]|nr:DNA mismatch repair endonuclease MutL [Mariprofundaceae bacterium]
MQSIYLLSARVANQIAAGEVVERPASAIKELLENSLDAGAKSVRIRIHQAGKKCIDIEDDGCGMSSIDASMALKRHATSKISDVEDLQAIASHGFRGEALPSIASVSRFRMHTALQGGQEGIEITVNQRGETEAAPATWRQGTRIEVRDLFLNTPARLRFMRTDKTEEAAIIEVVRGLALAKSSVAIRLDVDGRKRLDFPAADRGTRVRAIMGDEFMKNAMVQNIDHEGMIVDAFLGVPTYHHRDSTRMLFLVNGRVIRDRPLVAALRAAYRDVMFHDRYPLAVIYLEIDPADVDVNVHPSKREVRFKTPQSVRAALVTCVRVALATHGQHVAAHTTQETIQTFSGRMATLTSAPASAQASPMNYPSVDQSNIEKPLFHCPEVHENKDESSNAYAAASTPLQLGQARAQIHRRYIISQNSEGMVLIDQHAAHERINYERMKQEMAEGRVMPQRLLLPIPWQADALTAAWLHEQKEELQVFGVDIHADRDHFSIHSVPALLQDDASLALVEELVASCRLIGAKAEAGESGMGRVLERWLGNRACKTSLKSGCSLNIEEQSQLLRQMEKTP